ncbi:MAG: HAMP domain-containing protein [Desulfuromonadales bacterium]|nr:HAMP domain-containing protein [Desulfuromonadales bacterium]
MFSNLNSRAILSVTCAVTGFVIACCLLLYTFIKTDLVKLEIEYTADLADTVVKSTRYAMLKDDREMLSNIIDSIGDQQQVEHVRIFNKKGLIMFSGDEVELSRFIDKSAAGCTECHASDKPKSRLGTMEQARQFTNEKGADVLAITTPIYNEPDCFNNTACHFHDSESELLGTLDIGLSQAPLKRTLGLLQTRMIMFSVMVLFLTVSVVYALLYRQVFLPIKHLADFTEKGTDATLDEQLPEISGEVARAARSFLEMAERVKTLEKECRKKDAETKPPGPTDS